MDDALIRALRDGPSALPADLHRLHAYLALIAGLLAEKATVREATWEEAVSGGAETATLQRLEAVVAARAAEVEARSLLGIADKLAIWAALESSAEEGGDPPLRDRIVQSVRRDLDSLLACTAVEA